MVFAVGRVGHGLPIRERDVMSELAVVTAASPLTIRYDSGVKDLPALHLASYSPVVADRVAVIVHQAQILVLGKVI